MPGFSKAIKYLKIYFESDGNMFFREYRENFFNKKRIEKWYKLQFTYRTEPARFKIYKYEKWVQINNINPEFVKKFNKAYEKYVFFLREKKLKRITK